MRDTLHSWRLHKRAKRRWWCCFWQEFRPTSHYSRHGPHDQLEGVGQCPSALLHPGIEDPGLVPGLRWSEDLSG
ncbi:hypothetical protein J4Q44_G00047770 [Coregonus suidteri]|uniref:Uncharacterized protein n=1 Tax=Coregonus suidteri TaxID=861788 RepID=A0AAN8MJV1_9TELE